MERPSPARRAEDIGGQELSYAEVKAIASGNPAVLTLAEADAELQRLTILKRNYADEQYLARRSLRELPEIIERLSQRVTFMRRDFLEILDRGLRIGVKNDIFADFHHHLWKIEQAVQGFSTVPLGQWGDEQWRGFFMALRQALGESDWGHKGNPGGGFLAFLWHWRGDKFLRVQNDELSFRIEVRDEIQQKVKWTEWNRMLMAQNGNSGIKITTPRHKPGKRMTVAVLDGDYRQTDADGRLDLDRTVEMLRKAEALMDAALLRATSVNSGG